MIPFKVGDEVQCINGWVSPGPQTGAHYFVTWIGTKVKTPVGDYYEDGQVHLRLQGFEDGFRIDGTPYIWTFHAARFRPVVKTSISIFTEILERETEKEKV